MTAALDVRGLCIATEPEEDGGSGAAMPVVKGVSFAVEAGEVVALIGESGSGKTTIGLAALAYCRPGLAVTGGSVHLRGTDIMAMAPRQRRALRGRQVAYLAQSAAATFNPALPIGEQVTESAVLHGVLSPAEAAARAVVLYRALELPDPERLGERYPHQVSGGQLQRLMAAMALCGRPDLLVLDEPTTALDVTIQIEVLKAFKAVIREEGTAALYISHDLAVVAQIADRVVVLHGGEVQEQGPVAALIARPAHDYTRRLMQAVRPAPGAQSMPGKARYPHGEPVLELTGVSAGYGPVSGGRPRVPVLHDVDLTLARGEVVGVIGESGCGKSTLARVVAGLLPASDGRLRLHGRPLAPGLGRRKRDELRRIQIVFQMADTALNPRQRIADILNRPLAFYHGMGRQARRQRVAELLDMVELPGSYAERFPSELSGGQKQRVNLARALAAEPDVVLCDEVTSGLDTLVGARIIELLRRLRAETGVTFMFISHDLSTVAALADRIVVLYAGCVVESGAASAVLAPPWHPYTRLLIASVPELRVGWLETATARAMTAEPGHTASDVAGGCPFHSRCPVGLTGTCAKVLPPHHHRAGNHVIACHHPPEELSAATLRAVSRCGKPGATQS